MGITGAARPVNQKHRFRVEVDGITSAAFNKCSELSIEINKVEYREGGSAVPIKLPGHVTVSDITLSRGAGFDQELYQWLLQVYDMVKGGGLVSPDFKRSFDIVEQDTDGSELRRWQIDGAWPTKLVVGEWDNDSDEVNMEEVTLACDMFFLVE